MCGGWGVSARRLSCAQVTLERLRCPGWDEPGVINLGQVQGAEWASETRPVEPAKYSAVVTPVTLAGSCPVRF